MKYKNIIIPAICAIIGILIGYLIFGSSIRSSEEGPSQKVEASKDDIWTCSMHPQIRQNDPGECPICGMDLIPLDKNSSSNPLVLEMSEEAVHLAHIQTSIIGNRINAGNSVRLSGKIEADETTSASVVTHISGRIEKLYIKFTGEKVYKDQKVASIYSPELVVAQRELLEAWEMKDEQPALYKAARNKLKFWKISAEQIDEILSSGEVKENFDIRSEFSGVVQKRHVSVGDYVKEGGALFEIQNLNRLWAVFDVYEKDLQYAKLGNEIAFTTQSLPGEKFKARVSFVDPIINPLTRTAKIRVELSNAKGLLKPEMFVIGQMETEFESQMKISVPKSAVLWTGQRSVVYVKVPELAIPSFEYREVILGESLGEEYQVIDGLIKGEEIVTHGAFVIDASAQLNNQNSMMNRLIPGAVSSDYLPDYTNTTPNAFKQQLRELIKGYLVLKDALVDSDSDLVPGLAEDLLLQLSKIDMSLLKGESHNYWMEHSKTIKVQSNHMMDETSIQELRNYFAELSDAVLKSVKSYGVLDGEYYEMYCPMANKKEGASWLSAENEIRNPYFGKKMLKCGEVKLSIDSDYKNVVPVAKSKKQSMQGHNH